MQKTVLVFVALLVVAPLAGCADDNGGAADPTATASTTVTEIPTTTSTPTVTPTIGPPTPTTTPDPPTTSTSTPTTTPTPTVTDSNDDSPIEGGDVRTATVTKVTDGDTVEVEFANGETDTIRLLGVDTPETIASNQDPSDFKGIPDNTAGRDWLLNWGEEANEYARGQLAGE